MDPLSIIGLSFTGLVVFLLVFLHMNRPSVPRVGRWMSPPDVYVSQACPATISDVEAALKIWTDMGHEFGVVKSTEQINGAIPGAIFISAVDRDWLDAHVGRATWEISDPMADADELFTVPESVMELDRPGRIKQAKICIEPPPISRDMVLVLAHEIGHALGYLHVGTKLFTVLGRRFVSPPTGHLMHGYLTKAGYRTDGLSV